MLLHNICLITQYYSKHSTYYNMPQKLRSSTAKIILKDVPRDIPMTNEVSNYLSSLVGFDVPLICTFDGIPSEDGVYLKNQDGTSINKKISEMLKPPTKETAEKGNYSKQIKLNLILIYE